MSPPPSGYKPEALARAQLRHYVYQFDRRADVLPKRIDPALVERFLREELAQGRPALGPAMQMAELADFYDIRGIVPDLIKWLDHKEQTEEQLLASAALTRVVGLLGNDAQREVGRNYYLYLLSLPQAERRIRDLLQCYAVYMSKETTAATLARIDQILAVLKDRAQTEPAAATALRELEDLRNGTLPRVQAADRLQREILATTDPAKRMDQFVDIYLGLDMRCYEFQNRWAIRMILRESRAKGPATAVDAFRRALARLAGPPNDEGIKARRALVFHAIEFLGGSLTPQETAEMRPDIKRFDPLSND